MTELNLTHAPEAVPFAKLADVKALLNAKLDDASQDATLTAFIGQVSRRFTHYLGKHALRAERTEDYEIGPGTSFICLTGDALNPADAFSLTISSRRDLIATATVSPLTTYHIAYPMGCVRFYSKTGGGLSYARVTYTGGMAVDASGIKADYPDLHQACLLQVRYLNERRATLGGNITSQGGGSTMYQRQYELLSEVRDILELYRRVPML